MRKVLARSSATPVDEPSSPVSSPEPTAHGEFEVAIEAAAIEAAAEKEHEEWRQKKQEEMAALGATSPVPQWRRMSASEYKLWAASIPPDVLATVHCFSVPQPANPLAPLNSDGTPGDSALPMENDSLANDPRVHWCDIAQPYKHLPERWKAANRHIDKPADGAHSSVAAVEPSPAAIEREKQAASDEDIGVMLAEQKKTCLKRMHTMLLWVFPASIFLLNMVIEVLQLLIGDDMSSESTRSHHILESGDPLRVAPQHQKLLKNKSSVRRGLRSTKEKAQHSEKRLRTHIRERVDVIGTMCRLFFQAAAEAS